jgi:RNA polymerase sigma-70 factor (ECF subfamily)
MWDDLYTDAMFLSQLRNPTDDDVWTRFDEMYGPGILACCLRRGFSQQDAEDLSQDVLHRIVKAMPNFKYDPSKGFRRWVYTVIRTAVLDFLRKERRRPDVAAGGTDANHALIQKSDPYAEDPLAVSASLSSMVLADFIKKEALKRAKARTREPNRWACFEGVYLKRRTTTELATELGVSVSYASTAATDILKIVEEEAEKLRREQEDDPSDSA